MEVHLSVLHDFDSEVVRFQIDRIVGRWLAGTSMFSLVSLSELSFASLEHCRAPNDPSRRHYFEHEAPTAIVGGPVVEIGYTYVHNGE